MNIFHVCDKYSYPYSTIQHVNMSHSETHGDVPWWKKERGKSDDDTGSPTSSRDFISIFHVSVK